MKERNQEYDMDKAINQFDLRDSALQLPIHIRLWLIDELQKSVLAGAEDQQDEEPFTPEEIKMLTTVEPKTPQEIVNSEAWGSWKDIDADLEDSPIVARKWRSRRRTQW